MSIEKNTTERNAAAKAVRRLRTEEMSLGANAYNIRRTADRYLRELCGLKHMFDYVRTLSSKSVLDIGAGSTKAARQLSELGMARELSFEATTLSRSSKISDHFHIDSIKKLVSDNLGWDKTRITTAEVLRGIPNASKGAVLAVYSLPYSAAPELAVKNIDRVLVQGGVFKGLFPNDNKMDQFSLFVDAFKLHGYDTHNAEIHLGYQVILAIKPGKPDAPSAEKLFALDEVDADDQVNEAKDHESFHDE